MELLIATSNFFLSSGLLMADLTNLIFRERLDEVEQL